MKSSNHNKTVTSDNSKAADLARLALEQMAKLQIEPTPLNYAVWYGYVSATNPALTKEIDHLLAQGRPVSASISEYLYHKYIVDNADKKIIEDTTSTAKNLLGEILKVITEFNSHTNSYNQEVDVHVQKLTESVANTGYEHMVKEIIASASHLRQSGEELNHRLDESRQEIQLLKTNLNQISTEAQKDFLTGIANRKALENALEQQTEFAKQTNSPLCLLMLDIDHFKQYNDKFGHLIGDEVLKIVGKHLVESVKGKDFVARYGGEEFAVLLPSTPIEGGLVVADLIRRTISASELKRKDTGQTFGAITISVGAALYRPESDTIASLIQRADAALYASKKAGRNRVTRESEK